MATAIPRHIDGKPLLHRGEPGHARQRLDERSELAVKLRQFLGAQIAVNVAVEATCGDLNRGTDPVAVPVVAATGMTATVERDGEEFGVLAAYTDGACHPSPTLFRNRSCCPRALGKARETEHLGDRLPR